MHAELEMIASGFVRWWSDPSRFSGFEEWFGADMSYSMEKGFQDEDALWFIRQKPPWSDLEVESCAASGENIEIVGVGTDLVTLLRHIISWQLTMRNGKIARVLERDAYRESRSANDG